MSENPEDDALGWIVPCYLDASALVKLVVDEGDCQALPSSQEWLKKTHAVAGIWLG